MKKKKSKAQEKRDKKFLEAAKRTQFTAENQPKNRGRKKGSRGIRQMVMELLENIDILNGGEGDYGQPVAQEWVFLALGSKVNGKKISPAVRLRALEKLTDLIEGRPVNRIQMGFSDDDDSVIHNVTYTLMTSDGNIIELPPSIPSSVEEVEEDPDPE